MGAEEKVIPLKVWVVLTLCAGKPGDVSDCFFIVDEVEDVDMCRNILGQWRDSKIKPWRLENTDCRKALKAPIDVFRRHSGRD